MKTSGITGQKLEKLDALTSLRFFAASLIVMGHGVLDFGEAGYFYSFANSFPISQGVSLFFVLSGFILAYAYPELSTLRHVQRFFIARVGRIWPAHIFALLLLYLAIKDISYLNLSGEKFWRVVLANILMVHAWIPYKDYYESLNVVSWSISTEFFFYFLFPIFLYKWKTNWHIKLVVVIVIWVALLYFANGGIPIGSTPNALNVHGLVYINPIARLLEFLVGIAFCSLYKVLKPAADQLRVSSATFLEITALTLAFSSMWVSVIIANSNAFQSQFGQSSAYWVKACGGFLSFALLILIFAFQKGWVSKVLQHPWLVMLGEISFSLYLVHTFFLKYLRMYLKDFSSFDPALLYAAYWLVGLLLAYMIFYVVEKPCRTYIVSFGRESDLDRRWSIPLQDRKKFYLSGVALLGVIGFLVFYSPSEVRVIPREKASVISAKTTNHLKSPAVFNNSIELRSVQIKYLNGGQFKMTLLWKSLSNTDLKYKVVVHFLNANGNIIGMLNYTETENSYEIKKDLYWYDEVVIPDYRTIGMENIAIVLFVDDSIHIENLYMVKAENTDWDNRRLLISLKHEKN